MSRFSTGEMLTVPPAPETALEVRVRQPLAALADQPTVLIVNRPKCAIPEHVKRRRGMCSSCAGCRLCPMTTPGCKKDHIGSVNPTKRASSRKRKRRQSGGTPERDIERSAALQKIQECLKILGCDDDDLLSEWPPVKKMKLDVLENAASQTVKRLVGLIGSVSGAGATPEDERAGMLRVVGKFTVAADGGPTIAESNQLAANLISLSINGNGGTKRHVNSVICQSVTARRGRSILATAGTALGVATNPPGEYAWASRRADFDLLNSGGTLEPALGYVRLRKIDIINALEFIQNNCDLSWRNGHVVSRSLGQAKVEIPRLKRHLTMGFLFAEYARWSTDQCVGHIGRHEFYFLLRLVTVEVEEVAGASYYFTDGVVDTFKILNEMFARLKCITECTEIDQLETRTATALYFVKYELRAHLDAALGGCTEGFHCVRHAVNGTCAHLHQWSCRSCSALDCLCDDISACVEELQERTPDHYEELESMIACLKRVKGLMFRYVKHVARGLWQHARIADAMIAVTREPASSMNVLFVGLDHKQKVLGRKLVENQIEYFGKRGMSLLGAMVMCPQTASDTSEAVVERDGTAVSLRFVDMIANNGKQDNFQVISFLEALIIQIHEEYPEAENIVLLSDNASVFVSGDMIPWIIKLTRKYPFLRVSRYMNTEAQTGRDMLDAHFSFLNRKIDAFVRKDNAVQTPKELFDAVTDQGGVSNTTTLLLGIDSAIARHFKGSKKSFNKKVKSGVRKIHDTMYDQACGSVCAGGTPMCRIFTNSGVPNSEMTKKLADIESNGRGPRIPSYVCASTLGEQIVASLVEKTLSEPPHSTAPQKDEGGTLTGVTIMEKFLSTRSSDLRKTISQALATENAEDLSAHATSSPSDAEALRCSQCGKRYATSATLIQHQDNCSRHVCRDKSELIASALTEFFTLSKQQFAETRSRSLNSCLTEVVVSEQRSRRNWAEKESINSFGLLPDDIKAAIKQFFCTEREDGETVRPQDVSEFLMKSIVVQTDWDAKFLLTEQRLKTEISRLAK